MNKKSNFINNIFLLFFLAVIALIVFTPFIVREIYIFNREQSEAFLIFMFILLGFGIFKLHRSEIVKKNIQINLLKSDKNNIESRLDEAFNHIGKINVQISEIRSIFSDIKNYPESKEDLKYALDYFSNKILSIVNVDWVVIRIINPSNLDIFKEHHATRGKMVLPGYTISNKDIMDSSYNHGEFIVVKSDQQNLSLKAICILPKKEIGTGQLALIKAIVTRLELIYVIFSSHYYKNSRSVFKDND
ncbi:MAG: hypothetical protein WC906_02980 [Parcubacteria group bacterium]|jgi:hypothetical protein